MRSQLSIANSPNPEAKTRNLTDGKNRASKSSNNAQVQSGSTSPLAGASAPTGTSSTASRQTSFVPFDDFFIPYTSTLSLNWRLPETSVLTTGHSSPSNNPHLDVNTDSQTGDRLEQAPITISPAFEAHLRNLDNWSIGRSFEQIFPGLVDARTRIER